MKKVLVVEDDIVSARMLRDFLDAHGYETSVAMTGPAGVEMFHLECPDLMVVDVALPMKNGFEVCFEVKRTERGRQMPVILMSAIYPDGEHVHRYARGELGARAWLSKPFDLRTLLERVEELIGPS